MRTLVRTALIAGGAVVALGLGTAAAVAATGDGRPDDSPRIVQQSTTPSPAVEDRTPRPTPSAPPTAVPVPAPDDHGSGGHGADDPATHDVGDDHGADDPATHDANDDHGAGRHGGDDAPGDDHGSGGHGADD